jgi:hypothetical protein
VAAARKGETAQWDLADALLAEVKDRKGSGPAMAIFREVSEEIERETGIVYAPHTLEVYRLVAQNFPLSVRRKMKATGVAVSFDACKDRTPEQVFALIDTVKAKNKGKKHGLSLSEDKADGFQEALDLAIQRQHEREIEKQRAQLDKAKQAREEAEERARNARDDAARARARKAVEQAEREIDEYRVPPKRDDSYRPAPEMMPALMVPFEVHSECISAQDLGERVIELLHNSADHLDRDQLRSAEADVKGVLKVWEKALALVEKKKGNVVKFPRHAS